MVEKKRPPVKALLIVAACLAILIAIWSFGLLSWAGFGPANWYTTKVTGKVTDKAVKEKSMRVMIKPDDSDKIETFVCEDSTYFFNWDAADDFANLQRDRRFTVCVYGYRVPWLSGFRKIVSFSPPDTMLIPGRTAKEADLILTPARDDMKSDWDVARKRTEAAKSR